MDLDNQELLAAGLSAADCDRLLSLTAKQASWPHIAAFLLSVKAPFAVHYYCFAACHPQWPQAAASAWQPDADALAHSNIAKALTAWGFASASELQQWSSQHRAEFWQRCVELLGWQFHQPFESVLATDSDVRTPHWFPGARLNIVDSCLQGESDDPAIRYQAADGTRQTLSRGELRQLSARVANSLRVRGFQANDAIALMMPMTPIACACYFGIILAGMQVVAIADSFAAAEITSRCRIANAKLIITQDVIARDGKSLPLFDKIKAAAAPPAVVLSQAESTIPYRENDITWSDFLVDNDDYQAESCEPHTSLTVLFSSGTTGDPKAIPWDHTTPMKCAMDGYFHQDIRRGDVVCWPTNLGWMMGPWLLFAGLMNGASVALFDGSPMTADFGSFVEREAVTMLGLVPSMVKHWRQSGCMESCDWSAIRCFSSSGECSNPEDMLYLMWLAGYRPIIEYCGGTEIGGAYISSTVIEANCPSWFTMPTLGLDFVLLNEESDVAEAGEVALIPPSIGLSTRLLNRDHNIEYFKDMPTLHGAPLRRHGDELEHGPSGYRALGRADDTMNLGGIKVSSATIERVITPLPEIIEAAAIARQPKQGGPSELVICCVTTATDVAALQKLMQQQIREQINPLFKIAEVKVFTALPRTASNKIVRRQLRGLL